MTHLIPSADVVKDVEHAGWTVEALDAELLNAQEQRTFYRQAWYETQGGTNVGKDTPDYRASIIQWTLLITVLLDKRNEITHTR